MILWMVMERGDTFYLAFLHCLFGSRFPAMSEDAGHWSSHSRYSDFVIAWEASSCFRVSHSRMRSLTSGTFIHSTVAGAGAIESPHVVQALPRSSMVLLSIGAIEASSVTSASLKDLLCSKSYHIIVRRMSKRYLSLTKNVSSLTSKTFAISFSRDGLGTRYPISYCAIRFAPPSPRLRRSPSCFCVRPL